MRGTEQGFCYDTLLGRGLRHKIPNLVDRSIDGKEHIRIRRETREKRVKKKGRTEEIKNAQGCIEAQFRCKDKSFTAAQQNDWELTHLEQSRFSLFIIV